MRGAAALALAAWGATLGLALHERRVVVDATLEPEAPPGGPLVSIVVPARDEERAIARTVRSLLGQEGREIELIVVDDESRDDTRARALEAMGGDPRARLVDGRPLPSGWVGKSWACWRGVSQARGDWLLFTDADVVHAPDALSRTLALAERLGGGGVTLAPRIDCGSAAERAVMPAAVITILTALAPGPLARSPRSSVAVGVGGYMLVRRGAYLAVGGHRAIRGRVVDDFSLARMLKRHGTMLHPADGTGLVHLRMYHGFGELWRGWSKNASFGAGGPGRAIAGGATIAAVGVLPTLAALVGAARRDGRLAALGLVGCGVQAVLQRMCVPAAPTPAAYAPTLPIGMAVIAAAAVRGAADRLRGVGPEWRGRRYPAAT